MPDALAIYLAVAAFSGACVLASVALGKAREQPDYLRSPTWWAMAIPFSIVAGLAWLPFILINAYAALRGDW